MSTNPPREPTPHEAYTMILSHELRTPVAAILGYLDLLDSGDRLDDPTTRREMLAIVRRRASDLARLVSELTEFAELTAV